MATETEETETSSLGDEWQWISNDTAEVLRSTVESAFTEDPRKNWTAEELARWIRDVAQLSSSGNSSYVRMHEGCQFENVDS